MTAGGGYGVQLTHSEPALDGRDPAQLVSAYCAILVFI